MPCGGHKDIKAKRIQSVVKAREWLSGARQTYGDALRSCKLISDWKCSCLNPAEVKGECIYAIVLN